MEASGFLSAFFFFHILFLPQGEQTFFSCASPSSSSVSFSSSSSTSLPFASSELTNSSPDGVSLKVLGSFPWLICSKVLGSVPGCYFKGARVSPRWLFFSLFQISSALHPPSQAFPLFHLALLSCWRRGAGDVSLQSTISWRAESSSSAASTIRISTPIKIHSRLHRITFIPLIRRLLIIPSSSRSFLLFCPCPLLWTA